MKQEPTKDMVIDKQTILKIIREEKTRYQNFPSVTGALEAVARKIQKLAK